MSFVPEDAFEDFEPLDLMHAFDDVDAEDISNMVKTVSPNLLPNKNMMHDMQTSSASCSSGESDSSRSTIQGFLHGRDVATNESRCSAPSSQPLSFVNAYLIVDPITQQVVMPEQTLTCTVNGKIVSAVCGPKILEFTQEHILSLSRNSVPLPPLNYQEMPPRSIVVKTSMETSTSRTDAQTPSFSSSPQRSTEANKVHKVIERPSAAYLASKLTSPDIAPKPANYSDASKKVGSRSVSRSLASSYQCSCSDELLPPPPRLPVLKALTAYNFFFRDERDSLVQGRESEDFDWSLEKRCLLLRNHWYRDRDIKRRHRKTEGNIDFSTLSKIISKRWKMLPKAGKKFYRDVASRDLERFQDETNYFRLSNIANSK